MPLSFSDNPGFKSHLYNHHNHFIRFGRNHQEIGYNFAVCFYAELLIKIGVAG